MIFGYYKGILYWICLCHVAVVVKRFKITHYTAICAMITFAPNSVMAIIITNSGKISDSPRD